MISIKGLDMPETCNRCKLRKTSCTDSKTICCVTGSGAFWEDAGKKRMNDCPLSVRENKVMQAYFKVEDSLYGDKNNRPIETQSGIIWGALMVCHNHGDIDWNRARELYGEFMSKKMNVR